jgi:hypothetical protein
MPDMDEVGDLDLEEMICMMLVLTVYGFDFNIDVHVLECDLTGILDFGPDITVDQAFVLPIAADQSDRVRCVSGA